MALKKLFFIFFLLACFAKINAQTDTSDITEDTPLQKKPVSLPVRKRLHADSIAKQVFTDSPKPVQAGVFTDSNATAPTDILESGARDSATSTAVVAREQKHPIDSFYLKLLDNPFLRSTAKPLMLVINERERDEKDELFYLAAGLLFFLAFIKLVFENYFDSMFRLFFQPSFRQKQTREQLQQNNLPSLLLNLFFVFSAGAYVAFLLQRNHNSGAGFFWIFLYSSVSLALVYLCKYIFVSFSGWIFNSREAADTYIFVVYLINKIIGVALVPFIFIIAFSQPEILRIFIPVSAALLAILFIYRYIVSYAPISKEVKVSAGHFILYVSAFEIIPLLLIYKTLNNLLSNSL